MKLRGHEIAWTDVTSAIRKHSLIPEPELVELVLHARHERRIDEIRREIDKLMTLDQGQVPLARLAEYLRRQDQIAALFAEHARVCELAFPRKP